MTGLMHVVQRERCAGAEPESHRTEHAPAIAEQVVATDDILIVNHADDAHRRGLVDLLVDVGDAPSVRAVAI